MNMPVNSESTLRTSIDQFVEAFNVNDLDRVMTFFAADAVYKPGDGKVYSGPAEIRQAFAPQFAGAFGTMRFDEYDRLLDAPNSKVAIRWICRHDLTGARSAGLVFTLQNLLARVLVGPRFGWEGIDVFHFNNASKIVGKFTYANYLRPRVRPELGTVLHAKPK